jgi:hypothetical protein
MGTDERAAADGSETPEQARERKLSALAPLTDAEIEVVRLLLPPAPVIRKAGRCDRCGYVMARCTC